MIDIIIPCYNAHKTLGITLNSIINQSIKDIINVILVDDCSNENYNYFVETYKKYISIKEVKTKENVGAGLAREEGINKSNSKYIMFCDSDDIFTNYDSAEALYNEIEKGLDYVNSGEYDEKRESFFILNGNVHAKIFRRKYLEENNIHFNSTRYHEDNYFNNLVVLSGAKKYDLYKTTYYYTYNKNSITNDDKDFERLEIYFQNMRDLINIVKDKNYSKVRLARFKREKYRFLRRIYKKFNNEQKDIFKKWIEEYDEDFLEFIDISDKQFVNKLIDYLNNIIKD